MPIADDQQGLHERVLVVSPTRRDGELTSALLSGAGVSCVLCRDLSHLASEISLGAGAILLTEESLAAREMTTVLLALEREQPSWSDIPAVVLMHGGATAE